MRIACIPPCLSPIAYLLRKRLPLYAGQWRIHEGAIGIENVARFVRREFPHAAAWDIEAVAHARPASFIRSHSRAT